MLILRPYQTSILQQIAPATKLGGVLVQSPARSGKSKIIAALVERILKANKIPIVLTHRGKIQKQLIEHCSAVSIDAASDKYLYLQDGHCYVAMQQTIIRRPLVLQQITNHADRCVFIADEAHTGNFNKMFDLYPNIIRVGFTATPAWKWAKFMPKYYASLIHGPQVLELIASGNVTPVDYYEMQEADLSQLQTANTGDYSTESQHTVFDNTKLYDGLFIELKRFTFNKCIVFCSSKKSADLLNIQFLQHNYKSTVYYSGLKNGSFELAKFTTLNECNVLVTVSALSEGFDYPGIDLNILYRATTSLPLFIQMGMRGATPDTTAHKPITTVLDFGGNNTRFGGNSTRCALTMDRDWNALWQEPPRLPKTGQGVGGIKLCPACDFMLSASSRSCCNCGYIYPEAEVRLLEGELVRIEEERQQAIASVQGRRISTLSATELALWAKEGDHRKFAMRIAKAQQQSLGGSFIFDFAGAMGYKPSWGDRVCRELAEMEMYSQEGVVTKIEFNDIIVKI